MVRIIRPPIDFDALGGAYTTAFGVYPRAMVDAVVENADAQDRPPVQDLAIFIHESGGDLNPNVQVHTEPGEIPGSNGESSYGAAMIETRQNPSRRPGEQWLGIDGFRRALDRIINPAWSVVWRAMDAWGEWRNNPISFLDEFAPRAQGSIGWRDDQIAGWRDNGLAGQRFTEAYVLLDQRWKVLVREAGDRPPDDQIATLRAALLDTRQGLLDRRNEMDEKLDVMVEGIDRVL